jgi:hypothetical protein
MSISTRDEQGCVKTVGRWFVGDAGLDRFLFWGEEVVTVTLPGFDFADFEYFRDLLGMVQVP